MKSLGLRVVLPITLLALLLGLALGGLAAWKWQANSYDKQLAKQYEDFQRERNQASVAVLDWQEDEQEKRRALEDRLQVNDETHYKELLDAQQLQDRLRDRLATADLRLSVLLAAPASSGSGGVREASGSSSVVHGGTRAELDPAHAQRIVAITSDGDDGLIALQACQAYVREIVH
ncbi:lysis protein [Pseudomonas laurentiana]|uniref:Lysis protein n=1 Tax=Pseudomonas laurentiana TaxID=2364649 RepID=A0A6I5RW81_9PSED|nr:lysis system i-spanin subunit Rz [Pseudomonas laurentiana]NES11915.1 lysis protein [Pseudomonas laurentiana]GGU81107.1 lysis protein [Pseudomonas laurentiana]